MPRAGCDLGDKLDADVRTIEGRVGEALDADRAAYCNGRKLAETGWDRAVADAQPRKHEIEARFQQDAAQP